MDRCSQFGDLIDIYKIDFMAADRKTRKSIINKIREINPRAELLAEKIENEEEYKEALEDGYSYFQGYHFSKPVVISEKDIAVKNLNCFHVMIELLNPDFNIDSVENIVKSDLAMSYKLIKFLNSSKFGFKQEITSIRQAIMMLGRNELKKWLSLIAISEMQNDNNEEVTSSSIVRACFCELIALEIAAEKSSNAFMTGLFSNLDNFISKDMESIMEEIPLSAEVKGALLGEDNILGNILKLVYAYENMDMIQVDKLCNVLKYDKKLLVEQYIESINWLDKFIN